MNGNVASESKEEVKEVRNNTLELCMMGNFACFFCCPQIFLLQNKLFQKILSECQVVWIITEYFYVPHSSHIFYPVNLQHWVEPVLLWIMIR